MQPANQSLVIGRSRCLYSSISGVRLRSANDQRQTTNDRRQTTDHYRLLLPGEITLPYSLARAMRSNIRHAASEMSLIASSPSRSRRK